MQAIDELFWPPTYIVKKHRRARSVKLRASKATGLEITIPWRFNVRDIPDVLERHKSWIVQQLAILQARMEAPLPMEIHLPALMQTWKIQYMQTTSNHVKLIERPQQELVLLGHTAKQAACKLKLIAWLKQQAIKHLTRELQRISEQTMLTYTSIAIRDQKTVWGSCTVRCAINLNYKLLFLPPALMNYVLIHELCHTKHLNHSQQFWSLVAVFDPEWQLHRRALRQAERLMPVWV